MLLSSCFFDFNYLFNISLRACLLYTSEGCLKRVPSIAFSSCYYDEQANLEPLRSCVRQIVSKVLADGLPTGVCLNVNFPARESFEGVKVCRMTQGQWVNEIEPRHHPRGYDYFWVVGEYHNCLLYTSRCV